MLTRIVVPLLAAAAVLPIWTGSGRPNPGDARVPSRIVKATVYTDRARVTREAKADASGIITWQLRLAPGERNEIRVQYSIEAPADLSVGGIE